MSNFQQPQRIFQESYRLLKPGGIFALQLTVVDSLLNFFSDQIYHLTGGRLKTFSQIGYPFQHAYHFTRNTIKRLTRKYKFTIIKTENVKITYRYSSLPQFLVPLLDLSELITHPLNKGVRFRIYARKSKA